MTSDAKIQTGITGRKGKCFLHHGHALDTLYVKCMGSYWSKCESWVPAEKFIKHLETCLLIAEAERLLCHLVMFLNAFLRFTGCTKWNTAVFKILLLFMAGLFIRFLVEKCAPCPSHRKSDFRWYRFRFSPCLMRKRVKKSQGILALLGGFQGLHLDW